jgi:hypothetical protein
MEGNGVGGLGKRNPATPVDAEASQDESGAVRSDDAAGDLIRQHHIVALHIHPYRVASLGCPDNMSMLVVDMQAKQ